MNAFGTTRKLRPMRAYGLALILLVMPIGQTFACYTVNVYNNTGVEITALWGAQGCAGVTGGETEICESKTVKPQEVKSYDYNWGTTLPTVWMYLGGKKGYDTLGFSLPVTGGNFEWSTSAIEGHSLTHTGTPACDTAYTIVYTDSYLWEATANQSDNIVLGGLNSPITAGYIYGTDSNADNKCLQAASTSFSNGDDVHVWDHCIKDPDQKNRVWHYDDSTGYIHNVFDQSYCLHKKSSGYKKGDNIHMWKCDQGSNENKQWEFNKNGQHLLRSKANNNFCIVRAGGSVGDGIHLWSCDPNNNTDQNARWTFNDGNSG